MSGRTRSGKDTCAAAGAQWWGAGLPNMCEAWGSCARIAKTKQNKAQGWGWTGLRQC